MEPIAHSLEIYTDISVVMISKFHFPMIVTI